MTGSMTRPTREPPGAAFARRRIRRAVALVAFSAVFFLAFGLTDRGVPVDTAQAKAHDKLGIGLPAPDIDFTAVDGVRHRLSQFRGKPVMLWFFASWCPSCKAATRAVAENLEELRRTGLQIIQLRLYKNLGYPGPSADAFAKTYAKDVYPAPGWIWGDASRDASFTYDPGGYPDIYFLIDERGVLRGVDGVPNVTMKKIMAFAKAFRGKSTSEIKK